MNDFKSKVRDHYSSIELSNERLEKLQSLEGKTSRPLFSWNIFVTGFATLSILFAVVLVGFPQVTRSLEDNILHEVVKNHIKNMPSEIETSNLFAISSKLSRLDFAIINSTYTSDKSLVGARYCSIQGVTAAQLQYKDTVGTRYTVYQVPVPKEFESRKGLIKESDISGVHVQIYVEKGLLIGKAYSLK